MTFAFRCTGLGVPMNQIAFALPGLPVLVKFISYWKAPEKT